jgi:hypothetical protein
MGDGGRHRAAQVDDEGVKAQTLKNHLGDQGR